jgi:hypothetical protein
MWNFVSTAVLNVYFIKIFNFYRALRLSGKRLWVRSAVYGALDLLCSRLTPSKSRTDGVIREWHDCLGSHFCQSWHTYIFIISSVYQQVNEFLKRSFSHVAWIRPLQALCPFTNGAVWYKVCNLRGLWLPSQPTPPSDCTRAVWRPVRYDSYDAVRSSPKIISVLFSHCTHVTNQFKIRFFKSDICSSSIYAL